MKPVIRGTIGGMKLAGKVINDNFTELLERIDALSLIVPANGSGWTSVSTTEFIWDKTNWTEGLYPALEFKNLEVGAKYRVSGNIATFTGSENMRLRWGTSSNNLTFTSASVGAFDHTEVMGNDPAGILQFICNSSNGNTLIHITDLLIEKLPDPDITLDASILGLANLDPVTSMEFLTTSNAPTYNTAAQNGLGVIKFDGVANEMNGALAVSMVQFSYYMVVRYGTHKDNAGIMSVGPTGGSDWDNDNGVNFGGHGGASNIDQIAIRRGNGDNILSQWGTPPVIADFFLLEGHIDTIAGTFSGRVNGGAEFTDTFDHLTPINPDIFVLGCRVVNGAAAAAYSDMTFGEARLYNKLIPEADRSAVRGDLMNKWGI